MKRKLQKLYTLSVLACMLLATCGVLVLLSMKIEDTRTNLRSILYAAYGWTTESTADLTTLAEEIASVSPPLRVTFIMDHGLVLADSEADYRTMENHSDRQEILALNNGGIAESIRFSSTQSVPVIYAAMKISPQLILRLSYPLTEIIALGAAYVGILLVLYLVLYMLQKRALTKIGGSMVHQMDDIRRLLEGDIEEVEAVFPEFQPSANQIAYLVKRLQNDLQEVSRTLNLRDNFVANASHELRTPLTSIMGFAEMIDTGMADTPEEQELCIRMIRSECQRMLDVIQDILQLSRAESRTNQQPEEVNVRALAEEICCSLSNQAQQHGISFEITGGMTLTAVEKDIWEILYNLIGNAVRYGKENGHVYIALDTGVISVSDDGIGIAAEHLPHLFEQFYRVDEARSMGSGGTGLGLSIVKAIVDRCGGSITVNSRPGNGSCFHVTFGE